MSAPYSPLAIANEFVRLSGGGLTHMKLQKLVYYAQGQALARGFSLTNEQPQVWKFGPVFGSLYYELKYHGSDTLTAPEAEGIFGNTPFIDANDEASANIIKNIWSKYGHYTAMQLSEMTHKPGTPWHQIVQRHNGRIVRETAIDETTMRNYFAGQYSAL